jgi:fumarate hydratase class II
MPGKVNPVMSEMLLMVTADVVGKDATIAWAGAGGVFELNAMMPIMAASALDALESLAKAARLFADRCIRGISANEERCRELVERSLALGTALLPRLGYDASADVVNEAARTGKTVRDVCLARGLLSAAELDQLLDPRRMTEPRGR